MRGKAGVVAAVTISSLALCGAALAASPPSVSTGGANSIGDTSAALRGSVNPRGTDTAYYFQWGQTTYYGTDSGAKSAGHSSHYVIVQTTAGDLDPGTTYHFRLVATNASGTSYGDDHTFTTHGSSSGVSTGSAEDLGTNGAILTGSIAPEGRQTTWYFQWGTVNHLSQHTTPERLSSTSSTQSVASSLEGALTPGTVYQYRLVAVHPNATDYGATLTTMTYPSARPYAVVHAVTQPRNRQRYPYTFTTTGTIGGPSWIPAQFACIGSVHIRFYTGSQQRRFEVAPVQPNCTFSYTTVFYHLPSGTHKPVHMKVYTHFQSTGYLVNGSPAHDKVTIY